MRTPNRKRGSITFLGSMVAAVVIAGLAPPAQGVLYGGVDFPQGIASFADAIVSYNPALETDPNTGLTVPDARWRVPAHALGAPDYSPPVGPFHNEGQFVSLGNGGSIVLKFTNNLLTGSGDSGLDLWIFEVGPEVEAMSVDISRNGTTWFSVGSIGGATAGVDIDAFGFGMTDTFRYVRLIDDFASAPASDRYGLYAGADIDAVGAISTVVPEPTTIALLGAGGLVALRRRRRSV